MANVRLTNFTDFDRLLISNTFIVTLIGAILAFSLSYLSSTVIPIPYTPYGLSFSLAVLIAVSVYARNIASSLLMGIATGLGIVSTTNNPVYFLEGYIQFTIILSLILGFYSDKLKLVKNWTKTYIFYGFIFSIILVVMSLIYGSSGGDYWENDIKIGLGGDPFLNSGFPLMEIVSVFALIILLLIPAIILRGEITLTGSSAKKYKAVGILSILSGLSLSLVSMVLFTEGISREIMEEIAIRPSQLITIDNLFSHLINTEYGVFVDPVNGFLVVAFSVMLFAVGISFYLVGKHRGNIDGMRGKGSVLIFAPIIATLLFFVLGSYYLQILLAPGAGFFISIELFPVFLNIIWSIGIINLVVSYILYSIFNLIKPI